MASKILKLIAVLFCFSAGANSINSGPQQYIEGLAKAGTPSYILNPTCQKNEANITDSDNIVTRVATGGLSDLGTDCQIDADASGEKAVWAWRAYPNRLESQNCEAIAYYKGDASLYKINIVQDAVTVNSVQLTNSTAGQVVSINFPCGADNTDLVTTELEATDNAAALINFMWLHGGEATNIGTAAQAEVVVRATRITSDQTISSTASTKIQLNGETFDLYNEFDPTTNYRFTAKRAGRYKVSGQSYAFNATNRIGLEIKKNGSTQCFAYFSDDGNGDVYPQASCAFDMVVDDYVELFTVAVSDSSYSIGLGGTRTYMEISRFPTASEQVFKVGQAGLEWTAFTPTGSLTTNTTYTGFYKCEGDTLHVQNQLAFSGTNTQGAATLNLPTNFTIDTAKIVSTSGSSRYFGFGSLLDSGTTVIPLHIGYSSTTAVAIAYEFASGTPINITAMNTNLNNPITIASGDTLWVRYSVPVTASSPCPRTPAPLFKNAVTTPFAGTENVLSGELNCDTASTFNRGGTGMTAGNRSTTSCAITIATGQLSSQPWYCSATIKSSTVQAMGCSCSSATACTIYGPNADYDAYIEIRGPK